MERDEHGWTGAGGEEEEGVVEEEEEEMVSRREMRAAAEAVYEEEVLSVNYANYLNDEGNKIAFARFDDTNVKTFQYPFYGNQKVS